MNTYYYIDWSLWSVFKIFLTEEEYQKRVDDGYSIFETEDEAYKELNS